MPLTVQNFLHAADQVKANDSLYLQRQGNDVGTTSRLNFFQKWFSSNRIRENQATVQAFMTALAQTPAYQNLNTDMRNLLNDTLTAGKPLTAETVRRVHDSVHYDSALAVGHQLANNAALPEHHEVSFAQFVLARGLSLDTPAKQGEAVQRYLCEQVIPGNLQTLTRLADISASKNQTLRQINDPLTGKNGFFPAQLRDDIAKNGLDGAFTRLQLAFRTANADTLHILELLPDNLAEVLGQGERGKDILATLKEGLPIVGEQGLQGLATSLAMSSQPLTTPAERQMGIRTCILQEAKKDAGLQEALKRAGLPENFASAIANNPAVDKHIAALLNDNPGPAQTPDRARAAEVVNVAVQTFIEEKLPLLREFAIMGQDAPAGLRPPVTPETMPRYLNAMLAGDAVLEPLLNDSVAVDGDFLERIAEHAQALNSATHSFKGDYGADDIATVLKNSISMLLTRRGVTQDMLPAVMEKTLQKFGPLTSHVATLNLAVQQGLGKGNMDFLQESMTVFRSLEGHARALMNLMSREQQVTLGVAVPGAVDAQSEAIKEQDGERQLDFFENHFQVIGEADQIPVMVRDFARAHGLDIPRMISRQAGAHKSALEKDNTRAMNKILNTFLPEGGYVVETNTESFRELLTTLNKDGALDGLDADLIHPVCISLPIANHLKAVTAEATANNRPVDEAALHQALTETLSSELIKLKSTLDAIDALPADTFSTADKISMKTVAQRYGVRDANAIGKVFSAQRSILQAGNIALPNYGDTPGDFTRAVSNIAQEFCTFHEDYKNLPGSEDLLPMMCDFLLEGMSPEQLTNVNANVDSETAQALGGAVLLLYQTPKLDTSSAPLLGIIQVMNRLRLSSEYRLGKNPQEDPLYYSRSIDHLSEIPRDADAPLATLQQLAPSLITPFDVAMGRHKTQLTTNEWESLRAIHTQLENTATGASKFLLASWVESSASDLLAALQENKGKPLSSKQLWKAMIGGSMPRGRSSASLGDDILRYVTEQHAKLSLAAAPDTPSPLMEMNLHNASTLGISPKKILELTRPHAGLSLQDVSLQASMGSLRGINAASAYGLVDDFRRRGENTEMRFIKRDGSGIAITPSDIPDAENKPENPTFVSILEHARSMTQSEGQLARVMQCFSQAPLIMPRLFSTCFPGIQLSEHGNFSVTAEEQPDGSVVVSISSDPSLPLVLKERIRVGTDGSHTFEQLDLNRP